jgi:hypothetical protein
MENGECLEDRLKEAAAEDSRPLLEEFLKAFFLDNPEVKVSRLRPFKEHAQDGRDVKRSAEGASGTFARQTAREQEEVTFRGHTTV